MLPHVCSRVFLLTDLFSGLVLPYSELEVDPPKLHRRKNRLRITINQMKRVDNFVD